MLCSPTLHPRALQSLSGFQSSSHCCSASWVSGITEALPGRMKALGDGRTRSNSPRIRCGAVQSVAETMQLNDRLVDFHSDIGVRASHSLKEKEEEEEGGGGGRGGGEEEEDMFISRRLEHSFKATETHENSDNGVSKATTTPWSVNGASNLISDADESILENERRRRMRISETNKGQVPWNKGIRYTQEGRQSRATNQVNGDIGDDASLLKKEKQRRQKISSANKGKTPWNKGRQHSEETRRRIRERTMEAMKNPEIREKLRVHGSSLSSETRSKISSSLSLVWDARKKTKQIQDTMIEQWRECVADAARRGDGSNVAYEWNSYNLILKELQQAWSLNRRKRKKKESSIGLSIDHRIKISNAIKNKWANHEYRNMVQAGINAHWAKQSGQPTQQRRSIRRKETSPQNKGISAAVKTGVVGIPGVHCRELAEIVQPKKPPTYKNPSSAEMMKKLKQIREARALEEAKRKEVTDRARILMAEAQKATKALEAAAVFDKNALVPLREAQKLLAEAAWSFKSAGLETGLSLDTHNGE